MMFKGKIIIDKNFSVDVNEKTFYYVDSGVLKRLPFKNLVCCEVYADISLIKRGNINTYIETAYGTIPFFEDSSELAKVLSSVADILTIYFEDENGEIKSYSKRYKKEDTIQYKFRHLINNFIDEKETH